MNEAVDTTETEALDRLDAARRVATIADENVARATLAWVKLAVRRVMPDAVVLTLAAHRDGGFSWGGYARTAQGGWISLSQDLWPLADPINEALIALPRRGHRAWAQSLIVPPDGSPVLDLDKVTE